MSNLTLGQTAIYVSGTTGHRKAAQVVGTHQDTTEGSTLSIPEGTVNVRVFNPKTGKPSFRENVIVGKEAFEAAKSAAEDFEPTVTEDEDGYDEYDYSGQPSMPRAYIEAL